MVKEGTDASRINLAKILSASSTLQRQLKNATGSEDKLLEAREIIRDIIKNPKPEGPPTDANQVLLLLGAMNQNLGTEYLRQGRIADTAVVFGEAIETNRGVLRNIESMKEFAELDAAKQDGKTLDVKSTIDTLALGIAYVLMRQGKTDESIIKYDAAIAGRRAAFERNPGLLRLKSELAGFLALYGRSLLWLDRVGPSELVLNEAVKLSDEAFKADPERADGKRAIAFALYNLGALRELQGRKDEAVGHFERSRGVLAELYKASADEKNGYLLLQSESRVGNVKVAKELSDKLGAVTLPNQELHLERACGLAQLARVADEPDKTKLMDEALTALERSVSEGYLDPFRISKDLDLKPLHAEARFVTLLQKLKTQSQEVKK